MKRDLEFQLGLLLNEWRQGLIDSEFVSGVSLTTLERRLVRFIDRNIHIAEDDELHDFVTDHNHYTGG
jgi:hypothetical protein